MLIYGIVGEFMVSMVLSYWEASVRFLEIKYVIFLVLTQINGIFVLF